MERDPLERFCNLVITNNVAVNPEVKFHRGMATWWSLTGHPGVVELGPMIALFLAFPRTY